MVYNNQTSSRTTKKKNKNEELIHAWPNFTLYSDFLQLREFAQLTVGTTSLSQHGVLPRISHADTCYKT